MKPQPRHDALVRQAFASFCGSQTYLRFVRELRRVAATGRPLLSWQQELWTRFVRTSGVALPDVRAAMIHTLRACDLRTCGDCRADEPCARMRRHEALVPPNALRRSFRSFCGAGQYDRFRSQLERVVAVKRPMLTWQRELWARFTRATPFAVPDRPEMMPHLFHDEYRFACELCRREARRACPN